MKKLSQSKSRNSLHYEKDVYLSRLALKNVSLYNPIYQNPWKEGRSCTFYQTSYKDVLLKEIEKRMYTECLYWMAFEFRVPLK